MSKKMTITQEITKKKELKGLTTYMLAKNAGMKWQTVRNIEADNNWTKEQMQALLKALGGTLEVKWVK